MTIEETRRIAKEARSEKMASREQKLMSRQIPQAITSAVPRPKPVLLIDRMPHDKMTELGAKLYLLMNLTWSYIDTVIDICIQQRISATKPLVREIRDIRRRYDQFRHRSIDDKHDRMETHNAEVFEYKFSEDFDRLFHGLELEASRHKLTEGHHNLLIATNQALTLMDAVKIYARMCDKEVKAHGILTCDCCMLQSEFMELYPLIPQFAGDCYKHDISARKITAMILAKRIQETNLCERI